MSLAEKIKHELKAIGLVTLYFFFCFGIFLTLKKLFLAQVEVEFFAFPVALFGALVMAKVVILMDKTRLGKIFENDALYKGVLLKSIIYTMITTIVVFIEHVVHAYLEMENFKTAIIHVIEHRDINQFFIVVICSFVSLAAYNLFVGISNYMGRGELLSLIFKNKQNEKF